MLVKLKAPWFAPSETEVRDKIRHISGRRFKKGVQEIPEILRDFLPSSAEILDKEPEPEPQSEGPKSLKEVDPVRAEHDALQAKADEADAQLEKKRANMAKAREAAAKKRAEKKENK